MTPLKKRIGKVKHFVVIVVLIKAGISLYCAPQRLFLILFCYLPIITIIFKCVLCPGWISHKHFPLGHIPPSEAEWVKPGYVRSVSFAESCRSCNEYTEGKYFWDLQPEGFVPLCSAGGTAHDTSVHIRESNCALAHLKPISTLHPLLPKREPCGHITTKCQGALLVFKGLFPSQFHTPKL